MLIAKCSHQATNVLSVHRIAISILPCGYWYRNAITRCRFVRYYRIRNANLYAQVRVLHRPNIHHRTWPMSSMRCHTSQEPIQAANIRESGCGEGGRDTDADSQDVRVYPSDGSMMLTGFCSFNKQEEDFPDLNTYNDYLEKVENFSKLPSLVRGSPR